MSSLLAKTHIHTLKTGIAVLACLFVLNSPASAQRQLSQNQDGFESNLYEGNLNDTPTRDSTVVQREVPKDFTQWRMNPNTGLMDLISPDTLQYLFQNAHKTEGERFTNSHLGNLGSPRLSRLFRERSDYRFFIFDAPLDHFINNPTALQLTADLKTRISCQRYSTSRLS